MKMDQVIGNARSEAAMPVKSNFPDNLSPHCIGREFVRCYYTLLHDNPNKLHRFYLEQSTFVHGNQADETAECVTGQRAIHDKIMSLNFEDCRTKIKHVDSQPTIHNGVVVQVSGELSNAGKMPRRFMQTFVLGSEAPRKYYVHNDIFRYQDEVFGSEPEEEEEEEEEVVEDETSLSSGPEEDDVIREPEEQQVVIEPEATNGNHQEPVAPEQPEQEEVEEEEVVIEPIAPEPVVQEEQPEAEQVAPEEPEIVEEAAPVVAEPVVPEPVIETPPVPKGPVSWASIASSGTANAAPSTPPKPAAPKPTAPKVVESAADRADHPIKKETPFQPFHREERSEKPRRKPNSWEKGPGGPPKQEAPNSQQIFVGNLPRNTGESDLREVFGQYGNVIGVRVTPNNFGFVIFDREDTVQEILGSVRKGKQYMLRDQRLNVEEKKVAVGGSRGGPRKQYNNADRDNSGARGGRYNGGRRRGGGGRYDSGGDRDFK